MTRTLLQVLPRAPEDLTQGRLIRLGEGVGKVVYASDHWVVKRERSTNEIIALISIWKMMRKWERRLPGDFGKRLLQHPSWQLRFMRVILQGFLALIPRSFWFGTHIGEVWRLYTHRDVRGEHLAVKHLSGTSSVPETISFPPTRVRIGGWPGWLTVSEATERVEATLLQRLTELAAEGRFVEVELWLERLLDLRRSGWKRGVFSVDAHLKNFGVTQDRVVLLDAGGLTDHWEDVERYFAAIGEAPEPHVALGLGSVLAPAPGVAERFNERLREVVNAEVVRRHWPRKAS